MELNRFARGFESRQRVIYQRHDGTNLDRMAGAVDRVGLCGLVGNQSFQRKQTDQAFDVGLIVEVDAPVKQRRFS